MWFSVTVQKQLLQTFTNAKLTNSSCKINQLDELIRLSARCFCMFHRFVSFHRPRCNAFQRGVSACFTGLFHSADLVAVIKFKKRAQFLEFFVRVAEKGLWEGLEENVQEWCADTLHIVNK